MYADTSTTRWINTSKRGNFANSSKMLRRSPSSVPLLNFELALRLKAKQNMYNLNHYSSSLYREKTFISQIIFVKSLLHAQDQEQYRQNITPSVRMLDNTVTLIQSPSVYGNNFNKWLLQFNAETADSNYVSLKQTSPLLSERY